ncbi:MAG: hypothetical protein HQL12_07335 [Candidatus Omnitrophica bacterium]|nr:hypothetical protein [Candidatus Omnitrophota bacterium]
MPDEHALNSILQSYGVSNPISGGGGFNWWNILGGIIFGIIGMCAFAYGKKEKCWRPMVIGIALMVYPYFIPNTIVFFITGIALTAALYFWRE